jgi:cyclic beta-1,2-glucan synthetase
VTRFAHERGGIATELTLAVPRADTVKIATLSITNRGAASRRLTMTSYVEWVLGAEREHTRHQLHTRRDADTGALLAQNFYAPDFTDRVAFSWLSETTTSYTARRDHFIGRNGDLAAPQGLRDEHLSGAVGAGYDPCAALRCAIALEPGETRVIVILLGAAASDEEARALIRRHGPPPAAAASIQDATAAWDQRLSVISVHTPAPEFDALFNRWSLYQSASP